MRFMSFYRPLQSPITPASAESMASMGKFMETLTRGGTLLSTGGLSSNRILVRIADGEFSIVDGPFAESKELVAGWAILRHPTKEAAIEGVKSFLRVAGDGVCELREIYELEDFPVDPKEDPEGWRKKEQAMREEEAKRSPFLPPLPPGKKRYMALIRTDAITEAEFDPTAGNEAAFAEMGALIEDAAKKGTYLGGEGLKPTAKGVRVALAGGAFSVTDGPFTESKELVAGFSTIEVGSVGEAIAFARRMVEIHVRATRQREGAIELVELAGRAG